MTALPPAFWAKVRESDCLIWFGAVNSKGYPCFLVNGQSTLAHRLAYEDQYGPLPEGMTVDHTCRVRNCVNAYHLEAVTIAENNRRKKVIDGLAVGSTCIHDHVIQTDADLYRHPRGYIECRECRREQKRQARKAAA